MASERQAAPFRRCMPDENYVARQEAIVAKEYNDLPQAAKIPHKQMWTDLSLKEKFDYLLLDMRESRSMVIHQKQLIKIYRNPAKHTGEVSDSDSDSECKENEAELNQGTKKRKQGEEKGE